MSGVTMSLRVDAIFKKKAAPAPKTAAKKGAKKAAAPATKVTKGGKGEPIHTERERAAAAACPTLNRLSFPCPSPPRAPLPPLPTPQATTSAAPLTPPCPSGMVSLWEK